MAALPSNGTLLLQGKTWFLFDAYADLFLLLETIFFFHKCIQILQIKPMACLVRDHQYYTRINTLPKLPHKHYWRVTVFTVSAYSVVKLAP